jgi:hypothetical protein
MCVLIKTLPRIGSNFSARYELVWWARDLIRQEWLANGKVGTDIPMTGSLDPGPPH